MDEMVDRLLDILADKLTERLSAGHKELYTAKELAERYGVSSKKVSKSQTKSTTADGLHDSQGDCGTWQRWVLRYILSDVGCIGLGTG